MAASHHFWSVSGSVSTKSRMAPSSSRAKIFADAYLVVDGLVIHG
jgi:hypothetical protein